MASARCDGCRRKVRIAGGIADLWSIDLGPSGGVTLVLDDGSERFLCFTCLEALPPDATAEDVRALDG